MTTPSQATAAGVPVTIGGVEYIMSPLDDRDIAEIDEWLRSRAIKAMMDAIPGDATPQARDAILASAMRSAMSLTWISGDGPKMMSTVDGIARILWQSVKHRHPDIKYDTLRAQMFDGANVSEFNRGFRQVTGVAQKKGSSLLPRHKRTKATPTES